MRLSEDQVINQKNGEERLESDANRVSSISLPSYLMERRKLVVVNFERERERERKRGKKKKKKKKDESESK